MGVSHVTDEAASPRVETARQGRVVKFELLYRAEVRAVTGFFARRSRDPQTVADLTADTFVEAMTSFGSAPPKGGSERAWLFAIARHVYAKHCERATRGRDAVSRQTSVRMLDDEEIEELAERIDAEQRGRELLQRLSGLAPLEREAVELVDIAGLTPKQAAAALCVSSGALRVRLFRARAQLRKEPRADV